MAFNIDRVGRLHAEEISDLAIIGAIVNHEVRKLAGKCGIEIKPAWGASKPLEALRGPYQLHRFFNNECHAFTLLPCSTKPAPLMEILGSVRKPEDSAHHAPSGNLPSSAEAAQDALRDQAIHIDRPSIRLRQNLRSASPDVKAIGFRDEFFLIQA